MGLPESPQEILVSTVDYHHCANGGIDRIYTRVCGCSVYLFNLLNGTCMNKYIRLAGVNASILIILLIISDLVLGDWFRKKTPVADVPASIWGREITYDASMITGQNRVVYKRDAKGYRNIQDYGMNNIVLTIGGSTTDQRYVTEGRTWQDELNKLFAYSYQFVNGGIDGQSTYGHLFSINNWHSKELAPQKVRAVVFYFGINDSHLLDENLNAFDTVQAGSAIDQIKIGLGRHSFFYQRLKLLRERLVAQKNGVENNKVAWTGHGRREKVLFVDTNLPLFLTPPTPNDYSYYKSLVYDLAKSTAEKFPNAKLVFVQQQIPGCRFLTPTEFIDRHPLSDTGTTKRCRRLGEIYLSQDQAIASLPKDSRPAVLKMYLDQPISDNGVYDYVHTNELGSAEIAQYLRKNLPLMDDK